MRVSVLLLAPSFNKGANTHVNDDRRSTRRTQTRRSGQ